MEKRSVDFKLGQNGLVKGFVWTSDEPYKGIIVICHGMAEHIERYDHFANFLSQNGYIVFGYDQRGHGMSINDINDLGYMSDVDNFQILVNDLGEITRHIKAQYPNLPIYLFGHSMGSFVSQRFIEVYGTSISGVILSGSNLNKGIKLVFGYFLASIITLVKGRRHRSKFINNLVFGSYNKQFKPNRTQFDWLTRDNEIVDKYIADEKCGTIFTVSFFKDFFKGLIKIYRNFELVPNNLPILLISGDKDPVGEYGKGVSKLYQIYRESGVEKIEMKLYPDSRHEPINELNHEEVYNDVINWLNEFNKLS